MNDLTLIIVAIIAAVPATLASIFGFLSLRTSQKNTVKLDTVSQNVDGKMDKLLAASTDAAEAKGQLRERDAERAHVDAHTTTDKETL